ncbi:hypothetical protein BH09PAT2_BH09PAT2_07030 [soil metagenome]
MCSIKRTWRQYTIVASLVFYVLSFVIPVALPQVAKAAIDVNYNLGGNVYVNGEPIWSGFGVKVLVNGAERWATVGSGGWYEFRDGNALPAGTYTLQHNQNCSSNAPLQITVPAPNNRAPNINLSCPTNTLSGYAYINGKPAWKGFGIKANLGTLSTKWAVVENDSGWYQFRDGSALIAGNYTISHNHNCPSNMPVQWAVPAANNLGPNIDIKCPMYPLHGYVYINGKPAWKGFGVKAVLADGSEKWALADDNGWYDFKDSNQLIAGSYSISHNHSCPSNAPVQISIPANNNVGPTININCPSYTLDGYVHIDGKPAWVGFGVKAVLADGTQKWALVENNQGYYQFKDSNSLIAGSYSIGHNHNCPSNMPVQWTVPAPSNHGPNVEITCPLYSLNGYVHVDGKPAWIGFGVKAVLADGTTKWALVENDQGWYQFKTDNRLIAGTYTIHHDYNCPSTTPVTIDIPASNDRGPDINITCPGHSLNGNVYVDGQPAWKNFGVKAVKDGNTFWALTDANGNYSFQNLPAGTYYVGHNHPCNTDGGNPVTMNLDGNKTYDFRIICNTQPTPTPSPNPIPFPGVCNNGDGVVYRDIPVVESAEFPVFQGPGYRITGVIKADLEGTMCPEDTFQGGEPSSDVGLQAHSQYYDLTIYKNGKIGTSLETSGPQSVEFACNNLVEQIYNAKYYGECYVSYNVSLYEPGTDIELKGSVKLALHFYLEGEQIGLKFVLALGEIQKAVLNVDIKTATLLIVVPTVFYVAAVIAPYISLTASQFVFLGIPVDPGPTAAAVYPRSSPSEVLDEVQTTMGDYFAENSTLRALDSSFTQASGIHIKADGFHPNGKVYLLVLNVGKLFPTESALVEQTMAADENGSIDTLIDVPEKHSDSILVLAIDIDEFVVDSQAYLQQTISMIPFTGAVAVVHPKGVEVTNVYLPLIQR